ncbi:alcohol dehydrogenase-like regulatory protein ErcA [Desulfuribacillus alkaliarsenatis]|uniref:Alcohol dehydrogenase n=1 Tax=Desulfuribacillus alkaliarsenatis TaxID=766136 RepID=A0A1E5FYH9_9FIRM|nr:alcohol dehydrogenase-like regulatory protein ErcA [Desulfuribacillus alkaliarsenatis]OEF95620.1 alcohol dehydrogenase [Desulfuribacillus alkaliarsenatis]
MSFVNGLELRKFVAPEFIFGVGARRLAGQYAKNFGAKRVLLVTDSGVLGTTIFGDVVNTLEGLGISYEIFSDVSENPREQEVMDGANIYIQEKCEAIIAVGGGSPIDCAKGIGIVASNGGHILDYEGVDNVTLPIPPLVCIPTTSGASADVSQFAIITDTSNQVKIAIVSKTVVPDVALIDPQTLLTLSPYLTACTCMDAFTHAIEAYVSNASSPITDLHALEAIRYIYHNLSDTVATPQDITLRGKTMYGSLQAGLAFSNAILGAVHAMAHSLGGFLDLPHGECNAILLPRVIEYNYDAAPTRYNDIANAIGIRTDNIDNEQIKQQLIESIETLKSSVGLNRRLSELGVKKEDIPHLARKASLDPCLHTNPRKANIKDIEVIYEKAL